MLTEVRTVSTPRRSRASMVVIVVLLIVSIALLVAAYWGWDLHREVTGV